VQLIDAETDQHRWAQTYDRTERDFLTLHAVLAAAIAQDVRRALALEDEL
jgi:TolB-like protein